nr:MAG TPA: hypothetical protein [Caudoviricetes sp.]
MPTVSVKLTKAGQLPKSTNYTTAPSPTTTGIPRSQVVGASICNPVVYPVFAYSYAYARIIYDTP